MIIGAVGLVGAAAGFGIAKAVQVVRKKKVPATAALDALIRCIARLYALFWNQMPVNNRGAFMKSRTLRSRRRQVRRDVCMAACSHARLKHGALLSA